MAPELRLRVAKFGATPEDRARLRIAVGEPETVEPARLAGKPVKSREARLLRAISGENG